MAFDGSTRDRLQGFVSDARTLLMDEFAEQFQQDYGLDPDSGAVSDLESLARFDDRRIETARVLREILDHYLATTIGDGVEARKGALERMVREQAFTTLNRLAALRMMEARALVMECVGKPTLMDAVAAFGTTRSGRNPQRYETRAYWGLAVLSGLFIFRVISQKQLVFKRFFRSFASEKIAGRLDHTTSPSAQATLVRRSFRVHRIPPRVRDDRDPPLIWVRRAELCP